VWAGSLAIDIEVGDQSGVERWEGGTRVRLIN